MIRRLRQTVKANLSFGDEEDGRTDQKHLSAPWACASYKNPQGFQTMAMPLWKSGLAI